MNSWVHARFTDTDHVYGEFCKGMFLLRFVQHFVPHPPSPMLGICSCDSEVGC